MHIYKKLYAVATKHYEKQHGENGWCGVIACAVAAGCAFGKARSILYKYGRKNGEGSRITAIWDTLEALGYDSNVVYEDEYRSRTLHTAMKEFTKREGTFFIYSKKGRTGHVTCIKDGVVEDWANPYIYSDQRMRADKRKVWRVERITKQGA